MHSFALVAAVYTAIGALLFSSGCTKRERPVDEGVRTRTLLIGNQNEPASLDPNLPGSLTDMRVALALFEGLAVMDEKTAQPIPAAAERWDISPDGLTPFTSARMRNGQTANV